MKRLVLLARGGAASAGRHGATVSSVSGRASTVRSVMAARARTSCTRRCAERRSACAGAGLAADSFIMMRGSRSRLWPMSRSTTRISPPPPSHAHTHGSACRAIALRHDSVQFDSTTSTRHAADSLQPLPS
eukprot:2119665-Prymnesium_polylepis.1